MGPKLTNLKVVLALIILFQGCINSSKIYSIDKTHEDLRDVFILVLLTRDYLRSKNQLDFDLDKLLKCDSLGRISQNFEKIALVTHGGHIAIQYKFSKVRNYKVMFTDKESAVKRHWKVIVKNKKSEFDGEIQFEYGERFYHFKKIIVRSQ